jgi:hypothetical protein
MYVCYTKKKIRNESSILRVRQANRYGVDIQTGRSLSIRVKSKAKQLVLALRASRTSQPERIRRCSVDDGDSSIMAHLLCMRA